MASKNVESVASVQDNSLSEYGFGALSCPPRCALVYRVVNEVFHWIVFLNAFERFGERGHVVQPLSEHFLF